MFYDEEQGAKWYIQAAEHGDAAAMNMLIKLYSQGTGVPQQGAKALEWARKSLAKQAGKGFTAMYTLEKCMRKVMALSGIRVKPYIGCTGLRRKD